MGNTYLSQSQINRCAAACNRVFTKDVKKKVKEIGKKYGLNFQGSNQTNANVFFTYVCNLIIADPKAPTHGWREETFAQRLAGGWSYDTKQMFVNYLEKNPELQQDYQFIYAYKPEAISEELTTIMRESYIYDIIEFNELFYVDNYETYFREKYGIQNVDKKARQAGERVINFFDTLLEGIPNKGGFFLALNDYILDNQHQGDKVAFHNKLFQPNY